MIIIDSYKYRKYLLDLFPATVAYSLRKLRAGQTRAIRVRRSSDNAEQDIGFVGNELDTASLLSFCGVGDGFVTTWYDQSGNGRNAQAITQPNIVTSGVIDLLNTKPAIRMGIDSSMSISVSTNTPLTISAVAQLSTATSFYRRLISSELLFFFGSAGSGFFATCFGNAVGWYDTNANTPLLSATSPSVLGVTHNSTVATPYYNGTAQNTKNGAAIVITEMVIGRTQDQPWIGTIAEVIVFASALSTTDLDTVERSQGSYYGITVS